MEAAILIAISLAVGFYIIKKKENKSSLDIAKHNIFRSQDWFAERGLEIQNLRWEAYTDKRLVSSPMAFAVVGLASKRNGDRVGFVAEVVDGLGIMYGQVVDATAASHHSTLSRIAIQRGNTLVDVIVAEHRNRNRRA
jgi:hypothetical protein